MAELLNLVSLVASWRSLLLVVVVFGFAPGFCLRLIVLAYPRHDPRRDELIAELYAVPRIWRPLWVAEQLETALFEGLKQRARSASRWLRRRGVRTPSAGALDRALIRAVVRALERGRDFVPVPARDLARELALAQDLARELDLVRDLAHELQLARAGDPRHARQLARELALVRALELALVRVPDSDHVLVMAGEVGMARVSTLDLDLDLDLALELAFDRDLELAFERALEFARVLLIVGVLRRVRVLVHKIPFGGKRRGDF